MWKSLEGLCKERHWWASWKFLSLYLFAVEKRQRHFELSANRIAVGAGWQAETLGTSKLDWQRAQPTRASRRGIIKGRSHNRAKSLPPQIGQLTLIHTKTLWTGNELSERGYPPPVHLNLFPSPHFPPVHQSQSCFPENKRTERGREWDGMEEGDFVWPGVFGPSSCLSLCL